MFEVGLWIVGFVLFFGATWIVGKHHSERSAMRRTLKRRGYEDETEIFEEQNNTELQLRIEQANRRLGEPPETTRQITGASNKLTRVS